MRKPAKRIRFSTLKMRRSHEWPVSLLPEEALLGAIKGVLSSRGSSEGIGGE